MGLLLNRFVIFFVLIFIFFSTLSYITSLWVKEKSRADLTEELLHAAEKMAELSNARQNSLSKLDENLTRELQNAKSTINDLRQRVESNDERLRVFATCSGVMPQSPSSPRMDDDASPRLTPDAQQAYFTLRNDIVRAEKQIKGLQQYIREQCSM